MSLIAIGMNGLLAVLLLVALVFGVRLDRKLKGVRDGQLAFAKAVEELNIAAAKAQAGLAELRAATDEATDHLGGRIARAREATERLDKLLARADSLPAALAPPPSTPRDVVQEGGLKALLASVTEAAQSISTSTSTSTPQRAERALRPARPRPSLDDDLFEDAGGRPQ